MLPTARIVRTALGTTRFSGNDPPVTLSLAIGVCRRTLDRVARESRRFADALLTRTGGRDGIVFRVRHIVNYAHCQPHAIAMIKYSFE